MAPIIVITGANRGIGFEAAVQLAKTRRFSRIFLTVRTADKGPAVVAAVAAASAQPSSLFAFLVVDLESHASVRDAVKALPSKVDAVLLNAGGLGGPALTSSGITQNMAQNCIGNAVLVEGLIAAGKLGAGARVVFSGSETTRKIWLFAGFLPSMRLAKGDIEARVSEPPTRGTLGVPVRQRMALYSQSKLISGLYCAQLAKDHPSIYFAVVSPGGVATDVYEAAPQPLPFMMKIPAVVAAFIALGACHPIDVAARRYVLALTDESFPQRFPSGAYLGGPSAIGTAGPLTSQSAFAPYYDDAELQKEAARVVRAAAKRG